MTWIAIPTVASVSGLAICSRLQLGKTQHSFPNILPQKTFWQSELPLGCLRMCRRILSWEVMTDTPSRCTTSSMRTQTLLCEVGFQLCLDYAAPLTFSESLELQTSAAFWKARPPFNLACCARSQVPRRRSGWLLTSRKICSSSLRQPLASFRAAFSPASCHCMDCCCPFGFPCSGIEPSLPLQLAQTGAAQKGIRKKNQFMA